MHARRQIKVGEVFDHESIIGTHFEGEVTGTTRVAGRRAVKTTVAGRAWITGLMQYGHDPDDPFPRGLHPLRRVAEGDLRARRRSRIRIKPAGAGRSGG